MKNLWDPYGRRIDYLRVSVVDSCNLNCFYCVPESSACAPSKSRMLPVEDIFRIIQGACSLGVEKVRLTGGEPLVRKDILGLVSRVAGLEGIKDLSLTTNGILLDKYAVPLARAGLNRVNISLDSLDPAIFKKITRGGALDKTLEGIRVSQEAGLAPIKLNVVAMKGINEGEVANFARLTLDSQLHVRFIEYMPVTSRHHKQWRDHYLPVAKIKELCEEIGPLEEEKAYRGNGPAQYYRIRGAKGLLGFISPVSRHFCDRCNKLRVTSDGKIKPCLFSSEEVDLAGALQDRGKMESMFLQALELRPDPGVVTRDPDSRFNCQDREMLHIGG